MRNFMHIEDRRAPAGGTCGGKRFFPLEWTENLYAIVKMCKTIQRLEKLLCNMTLA